MSGVKAQCSNCAHTWDTRKPPDEIERPRCAECGADAGDIEFNVNRGDIDSHQQAETKPSVLTRAQIQAKQQTLVARLIEQLERINHTGPPARSQEVAHELRIPHRQLTTLEGELKVTEDLTLGELNEIEAYLDSIVETIDEHAEKLEHHDRISKTIDILETRRETLHADIKKLTEEKDALETELKYIKVAMRDVHTESEAFERGQEFEKSRYKIEVPCANCGKLMQIERGSDLHQATIQLLQANGYRHTTCP